MGFDLLNALAIYACIAVAACAGESVGRICDLGESTPSASEVVVATPSLDCTSRTCLRMPLERELPPGSSMPTGTQGLCTATCEADDDCVRVPESPCVSGFTCGVATTVGPFCCQKVCMCKDYVVVPRLEKAACDPSNPNNMCSNLGGRD